MGVSKTEEGPLKHWIVPPDLTCSAPPSVLSKIHRLEPGLGMKGGLGVTDTGVRRKLPALKLIFQLYDLRRVFQRPVYQFPHCKVGIITTATSEGPNEDSRS